MPLLEVRDLFKIYRAGENEVRALDGVSLKIEKGELVAVIGSSGSGKSTLMNILGCLDVPTGGEYLLDGTAVASLSDSRISELRNREIGFIFQGFNLIPSLTALENVELPLIYRGCGRTERHKLALSALALVGLENRKTHKPSELSGGQQQRVAIARTLALEPQILLMDEPFSALDEPTRLEMQQLIVELWHRVKPTILCITHSISEAVYLGERVWIFTQGPGQIAYDIRDALPPSVAIPPLVAQEQPAFKDAVRVVTEAFRRVGGKRQTSPLSRAAAEPK